MAMSAILTLRGMVTYKPDLFENLVLPVAPTADELGVQQNQIRAAWTINKADLVEFLCFQTEGMSLAFPDYDYMKKAIGTWSNAHIHEWQRMFDTLFYLYNPLWNKDFQATEAETENRDRVTAQTNSGTASTSTNATGYTNGYDGGTSTEQDPLMQTTHTLNWTHADKTISSNTGSNSGTMNSRVDDDVIRSTTTTEKGNIGVTTVQEMIQAERDIASYSFDEYLAEEFKKHFCLLLW